MFAIPTDYAVNIFHDVIETGRYECFLHEDSRLPMIYLPDCIRGIIKALESPQELFKTRYVVLMEREYAWVGVEVCV